MAKTNIDQNLKKRIEDVIKHFEGRSKEEVMNLIVAQCGVTLRTAKDHYENFMARQKGLVALEEVGCVHDWSIPFGTAGGLVKECRICGKTQKIGIDTPF